MELEVEEDAPKWQPYDFQPAGADEPPRVSSSGMGDAEAPRRGRARRRRLNMANE